MLKITSNLKDNPHPGGRLNFLKCLICSIPCTIHINTKFINRRRQPLLNTSFPTF